MDTLDYLSNLNCQEENAKMAVKLPRSAVERWDRVVDDAMYGDEPDMTEAPTGLVGHFPTFHEFCKFVGREARIVTGSCIPAAATKETTARRKTTSMQAVIKETALCPPEAPQGAKAAKTTNRCLFCRAGHWLYKCQSFLDKPAEFKRNYARDKSLCFGCLRDDHVFRDCTVRNNELMREPKNPPPAGPAATPASAASLMINLDDGGSYSSTVLPVWVYLDENDQHRILTYALVDSQSSGCFISDDMAHLLQLEPEPVNLELTTLGSKRMVRSGVAHGLRVKGEHGAESIALPRCYTRRRIPGNIGHVPDPEMVRAWSHMSDVADALLPPRPDLGFGLLIGFNCSEASFVEEYRRGGRSEPFAERGVLGWTVSGRLDKIERPMRGCLCFHTEVKERNMEEICRAFDQGFEATVASDRKLSQDDATFLKIMKEGMTRTDDSHYQVPLPFRERPTDLPDSRSMVYKRLMTVGHRMQRDREFGAQFAAFMEGIVTSGQAELVSKPDLVRPGERWYWCVHGVVHPRKPGKVRGVFDGRAAVNGVAINDRLLTGPDQTNNLVGVLVRFRRERVAVTCDIEGMFLQVRVRPEDRQYLRFLWFEGGDPCAPVQEYQMAVTLFGAASSPGCANMALRATADRFEDQYGSEAADFVRDDFYVDDGLGATPDEDSAVDLIRNSRGLCSAGGFNLCKFASSSRAVIEAIPPEWRAKSMRDIEFRSDRLPNERTLGLLLSLERDSFLYAVELLTKPDTRRGYLSSLSSIFDPLGLVAPVLLPGRLLLKGLCQRKFGWDDEIGDDVRTEWRSWYDSLRHLDQLQIPRCFRRTVELPVTRAELHTFSDASSRGYGACCYVLIGDEQGHCDVTLLYAKARVVPSKPTTVPRLELQAAVLGVKMARFIEEELRYPGLQLHFWTDAMVVLGYIMNEARRFHVYVANRTQFIRSHTESRQWHHIDTASNPADMSSRGCTSEELVSSELWWEGPSEMRSAGHPDHRDATVPADDPELKREATMLAVEVKPAGNELLQSLLRRYSSWARMVEVVAGCLRFAECARGHKKDVVSYREAARRKIVGWAQEDGFPDELELLRGHEYPRGNDDRRDRRLRLKSSSNLYKLDVYCDADGLLRVGGRLRRSGLPRDMMHPVVVPVSHPLAVLIARHHHERCHHMGATTTLNAIRQGGYWMVHGRGVVSSMIRKCVKCQRHRGDVAEQQMADLPEDRFETAAPFTYVAVDMFGPQLVKVGRSLVKWWVCIFVCMASRAIHMEPVSSLDVSGFIQAYRRFVARRGPVRALRCDRGTNFTGAKKELENAWREMDMTTLKNELRRCECDLIDFRYNYPKASNMAGSWERMIRTVRSAFWQTLQQHGTSLSMEVFFTLVAEAEAVVNSRPITTVDMSDDTTPPALTPSMLLTMKPDVLAPPPGKFQPEDQYSRKRWRLTQYLADQFWRRWVREYILARQSRDKWNETKDNMDVGDIVLVVEADTHRGSWPLARIVSVDPSQDGLVRKVTVKTATSELQRPVNKLVLIHRPATSV